MLYGMLEELEKHKRNREDIFRESVNERLNKSLKTYYDSVLKVCDKLETNDELRVLRKLNKM